MKCRTTARSRSQYYSCLMDGCPYCMLIMERKALREAGEDLDKVKEALDRLRRRVPRFVSEED